MREAVVNKGVDVKEEKKKAEFPHIIILLFSMIMFASLLTYILPAGVYDKIEGTKMVDPNSFHFIENTPVSPWTAFLNIQQGITKGGFIISLFLILGGGTAVLIKSGAVESIVVAAISKYKDKSVTVVFPVIYLFMSILGALCGNDTLIAFVAVGTIISKRLKLDKMCALSLFYLPYIQAQAAGPTTAMVLTAQNMLGLAPVSGLAARILIWALFTIVGMTYSTLYAIKIQKDPENSVLGLEGCYLEEEDVSGLSKHNSKFEFKAVASVAAFFGFYLLFAYGSKAWGWGWNYLTACIMLSGVVIAILNRMSPNKFGTIFFEGARGMGGVCFLVGFAKVISMTLADGNIIHTIAYYSVGVMEGFGASVTAIGMLMFNMLFNFIMPGGITQAAVILPIMSPIGDVLGISKQVVALAFQLGDGLTNCLTPLSVPMIGAITLAGVKYPKWARFALPVVLTNTLIASVAIFVLQAIGWN